MLSLDVMDISGDHQGDLSHNIQKTRVSKEGYELETLKTGGEFDVSYLGLAFACRWARVDQSRAEE